MKRSGKWSLRNRLAVTCACSAVIVGAIVVAIGPSLYAILHAYQGILSCHPEYPQDHRSAWLPSRGNFFVPVKALSPISRTMWQEEMSTAGLLEHIDPQVWHIPWNVHSQAKHNGHSAFTYLEDTLNGRRGFLEHRSREATSRVASLLMS